MRMHNFCMHDSPNENFFRKPVNVPCFFHSRISTTCQKSKSDINLSMKYWRLKNTEISLARGHFPQACSFHRMHHKNHKNFHFTQIWDKTNDTIFLKVQKTMFWDNFWPCLVIFAQWGFFPKKSGTVTQL